MRGSSGDLRFQPSPGDLGLGLFFSSNPNAMWIYEQETLRFLAVNDAAVARYGYSADEFLRMSLRDIRPAEDIAALERSAAENGGRVGITKNSRVWRHLRKDGTTLLAEIYGSPCRLDGREAVLVVALDVTGRVHAEETLRDNERRFRSVLENALDAAYRRNVRTDRYEYLSPVIETITGFSSTEFVAMTTEQILALVHPDDVYGIRQRLEQSREAGRFMLEYRFRCKSGDYRWLGDYATVTVEDGRPLYWSGIVRDITAQKQAEEALRDADRKKDEFLAVLSHELRNPLAPLPGALFILDHADPRSPQAAHAKAVIRRQVDHLTRLVNDLLDATRISKGKIQLQLASIDLGTLVAQTVEDLKPISVERQVSLELVLEPTPVPVNGDATRLAQIVTNLLHNSLKFTGAGGRIVVRVEREAAGAALTVADTGVGIPPQLLGRVFDPFVQGGESVHGGQGGVGLGLALVKELAKLHGGTVEATSEGVGRGARFTVRLPAQRGALHEPSQRVAAPARAPARPRRVLIIEDDADSAETLRIMLEMKDHRVEVARDGREGLAAARRFAPEIVLCDIGLPEMNGYQVASAMRSDPALSSVLLVALTGHALPDDQRRAADAGFDLHLAKPASIVDIEQALSGNPRRC